MCYRLDEVKAYANKAEAIATYFSQINDDEMENIAVRIKARAYRRLGEIVATYQNERARTDLRDATDPQISNEPITQRQAAAKAGLSKRNEKTASRTAKIPKETFEAEAERPERPPAVTELDDNLLEHRDVPQNLEQHTI